MNPTFEKLYRQLGRATITVLIVGLSFFGLALGSALLGLREAVASFNSATLAVTFVFAVLLGVFLLASLCAALLRWIDRRQQTPSI